MIKFANQTPPPKRRITSGESHPGSEAHPGHDDVRDLGDGPWRKQLGGVNLKRKVFCFFWEVEETRGEKKEKKRCCAERNWTFDCWKQ